MQLFGKLIDDRPSRLIMTKMLTFGLVGVVNTIVDLAVFTVVYEMLGLPLIPANIVAWLHAVSVSYILNSTITFRAETGRTMRRMDYLRFMAAGVIGVVATTTTLVVLANFTSVLAAKLMSVMVSFVVNFSLSYLVIFRRR